MQRRQRTARNTGLIHTLIRQALVGLLVLGLVACGGSDGGDTVNSHTVTPTAGTNGSISPATVQTIQSGNLTVFTVSPDTGYQIASVSGCDGFLLMNTYITGAVTADCTVEASFAALGPRDLRATAGHQVHLAWVPVVGATAYCVYVSENPGINLATAASYDTTLSDCTGNTDPLHTPTGLSHGTRYHFVVTAILDEGETGASAEVSATPVSSPVSDTGIHWCANGTTNNLSCPQAGYAGQDGDHGRDADGLLIKVGGGHAGFDYTRVCNSGELAGQGECPASPVLGSGANNWACTLDNHTGLMWEVKVNNLASLHHMDHTFSWYNSDNTTNGGNAGTASGGSCNNTVAGGCDTEKFVAAVNDLGGPGLCGHKDWRMPNRRELLSIVHNEQSSPAIDTDWFPNTPINRFWLSSPHAGYSDSAWLVRSGSGNVEWLLKHSILRVRLVRAGQ